MWIEVNVRDSTSTGVYEKLSPRQEITSTPYAIHAQFVAANAVTDIEIQDNSITTADLANDSVTAEIIAENAVGISEIDSNQVQRRIIGGCANNEFIEKINQDGSLVCRVDDSSGLTSVTSAEIVDGTIVALDIAANTIGINQVDDTEIQKKITGMCGANKFVKDINQNGNIICGADSIGLTTVISTDIVNGTIITEDIADNAIKSSKIAPDAVGVNEIKTDEVQQRVTSVCTYPHYLVGINQDGSVICNRRSTLDDSTNNDSGSFSSIAIGLDGLPAISYYEFSDSVTGSLKFIKCLTLSCSEYNSPIYLDFSGNVGQYVSLAIGSDGNPITSYYDKTNEDLKIVKCTSPDCSIFNPPIILDSDDSGAYSSLVIGNDNMPIISYQGNSRLRTIKCLSVDCIAKENPRTHTVALGTGKHSSIIIGNDGNPVILHYRPIGDKVTKLTHCTSPNCDNIDPEVDIADIQNKLGLVLLANGNIMISYAINGSLVVVECTNSDCSTRNPATIIDPDIEADTHPSIVLGGSTPIISYKGKHNRLNVVKCTNNNCTSFINPITLATGKNPSIAIGSDQNPIISFFNHTQSSLDFYSCVDSTCNN